MRMIHTTPHNHDILLKNERHTWKHVKQTSYYQKQKIPFNKLNKINPTHIRTSHFSNLNNNSKTKEKKDINMKYFEKNRKLIPFLEVWRKDDDENGGFLRETRWVCERDKRTRQWTIKVNEGKKWKVFKTRLKAQNMRFSWLKWVVNKSINTPCDKIGKICLSVFRD